MKFTEEVKAEVFSRRHRVDSKAEGMPAPSDFHGSGGGLEDDGPCMLPSPCVHLGGLSFMRVQLRGARADRRAEVASSGCGAFPLQLRLPLGVGSHAAGVSVGHDIGTPADAMARTDAGEQRRSRARQGSETWIIGLPAAMIACWLHATPAAAARRLEEDAQWPLHLNAYLRPWKFEQLEALTSPFEKALIGEHVMSLLSSTPQCC